MATEKIVTDEVMEFLNHETFQAHALKDILTYIAKDGTEYSFKVTQIFGSDDLENNDGFHAFATVLLDENGDETTQNVFVIRGTSDYLDSYADMDENACGWPIFMAHKDEVLAWYNTQNSAGNEVSFTGTSLGGILSQMFSGYIHQETGEILNSVVTFSSPGIEKYVTYEGVTYDFSETIAETVHHYFDSGDMIAELGSYYIEGDMYLYGNNYYLDQAGDGGKVVRFKDYLMQPHIQIRYLLSDAYKVLQRAVFITEMKTTDMTGAWNPLSVTVDEVPEGIENTNNTVVTVGDNTYLFNRAYAEIVLSMAVSSGVVDVNYASKYVSRQKWEEMRSTEEGRQDFLGTALMWDCTTDVNLGISGSFSQGGKDYAVITLTGTTDQGKEFLYCFSDGCFLETEDVVTDGNWQNIAGAQTYTVEFDELPSASETTLTDQSESSQNKTYSTEVTNEMIEAIKACTTGAHQIGDVFEYTSQDGLTYRLKYTELYGSDDPEMNDGFHATGLVLLDVDGVTETDEHFLLFRATSGFPDAIANFYQEAPGLPLFAAHTQEVLDWYEKYEGEKITFSGSSLGSGLAQFFAGWLVNDEGKDKLTRLVGFLAAPIVKEATYEEKTYHFITNETVAETVEYYRQAGDILGGLGQYYQKGTMHLYGGTAQLDQAEGVKLHEYLTWAHMIGTYLTGGTSALTYLGDFDSGYFDKDANFSDLAIEVDAVPEGLGNTNIEAITCGEKIYLFNTEYADVALTIVSYGMANYDETLEDFFEDASLYTCRKQWEACRGADKQEALARLMIYDNSSDIEVSTGRGLTLDGEDYVELANTGSSWTDNFFYSFTDREFVAGNELDSASSLGEVGGVTFSVNGNQAAVALAGEVITLSEQAVAGYCFTGFTSDQVTISTDNTFTMPEGDVTVTANYIPSEQPIVTINADTSMIQENVTFTVNAEDAYSNIVKLEYSINDGTDWTECAITPAKSVTAELTATANNTTYLLRAYNQALTMSEIQSVTFDNIYKGNEESYEIIGFKEVTPNLPVAANEVTMEENSAMKVVEDASFAAGVLTMNGTDTIFNSGSVAADTLNVSGMYNVIYGDLVEVETIALAEGAELGLNKNQYDNFMAGTEFTSDEGKLIVSYSTGNALRTSDVDMLMNKINVTDVKFMQDLVDINRLNVKSTKKTVIDFQDAYGTTRNDTIRFYKDSNLTLGSTGHEINLEEGSNTVQFDKNATTVIKSDLTNVSTVKAAAESRAVMGDVDFQDGRNATLKADGNFFKAGSINGTDKKTTITIGKNAEFVSGNIALGDKADKLSVKADSKVGIGTIEYDEAGKVAFTGTDLDFNGGNDTLEFKGEVFSAGNIDFGTGNDTLTTGTEGMFFATENWVGDWDKPKLATYTAANIDFGNGNDKLSVGKKAGFGAGSIISAETISLGGCSSVHFTSVDGTTKLTTGNGAVKSVGDGKKKISDTTSLLIASRIVLSEDTEIDSESGEECIITVYNTQGGNVKLDGKASISIGKYNTCFSGSITADESVTISVGTNSVFYAVESANVMEKCDASGRVLEAAFLPGFKLADISGVKKITTADGNLKVSSWQGKDVTNAGTYFAVGNITGTDANDTYGFGANNISVMVDIDMGEGTKDCLVFGKNSSVLIYGGVTGVEKLQIKSGVKLAAESSTLAVLGVLATQKGNSIGKNVIFADLGACAETSAFAGNDAEKADDELVSSTAKLSSSNNWNGWLSGTESTWENVTFRNDAIDCFGLLDQAGADVIDLNNWQISAEQGSLKVTVFQSNGETWASGTLVAENEGIWNLGDVDTAGATAVKISVELNEDTKKTVDYMVSQIA